MTEWRLSGCQDIAPPDWSSPYLNTYKVELDLVALADLLDIVNSIGVDGYTPEIGYIVNTVGIAGNPCCGMGAAAMVAGNESIYSMWQSGDLGNEIYDCGMITKEFVSDAGYRVTMRLYAVSAYRSDLVNWSAENAQRAVDHFDALANGNTEVGTVGVYQYTGVQNSFQLAPDASGITKGMMFVCFSDTGSILGIPLTFVVDFSATEIGSGDPLYGDDAIDLYEPLADDFFSKLEASSVVYGCTDPRATNYEPGATVNDGSCVYEGEEVPLGGDTMSSMMGMMVMMMMVVMMMGMISKKSTNKSRTGTGHYYPEMGYEARSTYRR